MVLRTAKILLLLILVSSCTAGRHTTGQPRQEQDGIVFHEFMALNRSGSCVLLEQERVIKPGRVREVSVDHRVLNHPVEVMLLDRDGRRLSSTFIEHPLVTVYEVFSPQGEMSKTTHVTDSASFSLRYNNNPRISSISFSSVSAGKLPVNQTVRILK